MKVNRIRVIAIFALLLIGVSISVSGNNDKSNTAPVDPKQDASVSIQFDGLMALCFGNPQRASVGFLNAPNHTPEITVTRIKGETETQLAVLRGDELRNTLNVDVEGGAATAVARYQAASMDDVNDFRWTVDLESDIFHRQLYIKDKKLFGKVHFSTGLFYAGKFTERAVRFYSENGQTLPFNRRIAAPAAKINLSDGESLVIRGGKETLRLTAEPGVRYKITVFNLPPADMMSMDHFLFYYDAIGANVPKYSPVMVKPSAFMGGPVLCSPSVFSRSALN